MFDSYSCIRCKGNLEINADLAQCSNCKEKYPISEGVLIFAKDSPRFISGNPSLDKLLKKLVFFSRTEGCINALRRLTEGKYGLFDYVTDLGRVDFKYLLPLTKESNILDVGAGLGLVSLSLAKTAKSIHALEKVLEYCKFIQLRATQEGIANISIACEGQDCILPYRDNVFDIVILNGVFEWVGFETTYNNVKNMQKQILKEIHRVLKEEGTLYITTKNKYSLELNISKNLHNNEIRGILFLPDALINWISKKLKGREYLSGLLPVPQYLDLLRQIGFYAKKTVVTLPNFRYPQEFLDFNTHRCKSQKISPFLHSSRLFRVFHFILPWNIEKRLCYSHAFVLTKNEAHKQGNLSIIESIIKQEPFLQGAELISLVSGSGSSLASAVIAHIRKDKTRFLCKIARFEKLPFLWREYNNLKSIESLSLKQDYLLPDIRSFGNVQGFDYSVFPYYSDYNLSARSLIKKVIILKFLRNKLLSEIANFLIELALKTKKNNSFSFLDHAEKPILNFLKIKTDDKIYKLAHKHLETLQKGWSGIPLIYAHNDLSIYNFIIEKLIPLKFKIIDWESMEEKGFPAIDLMRICESIHTKKRLKEKLLRTYCIKLDFNPNLVPALRFLNLVRNRERLIVENQCHLLPEWEDKEKLILRKIYSI